MTKLIASFLAFALLSVSSAVLGQAEPESEEPIQFTQPEAPTEPNSAVLQFQNWAVRCARSVADNPKICTMFQRITNQEDQALLTITLVFLEAGKDASVIYNTPLGVSLQFGLIIEVEDKAGPTFNETLQYTHCNQTGCYAFQFLDKAMEDLLTSGRTLNVTFSNLQDQTVKIPASLIGFTAGFESLRERSSE